ncbi:MAG TPA: CpaF family protein [Candidatus Dormibacteraeota bacterium]|nr:CpaF family protein [Candidatus Dormibacteraeota bacterium]
MAVTHSELPADQEGYLQALGPLRILLEDDNLTEIMVVGPDMVYVESHGRIVLTDVRFKDTEHLMKVIDLIVSAVGRRIDTRQPLCDARLLDGSRVNAVVPPIAIDGPLLTIRKFAKERMRVTDLIHFGTLTEAAASFLQACVLARANILISGGTGSGKTTLLNICSGFIPPDERIVTVEDAAELQLHQEHVCRMESRPPDVRGEGRIGIRELVINALRMRPDRIVVGEVRGGEALDMLQAMNTGHDGSMTTVHANTPRDSLARLETQVLMGGIELPAKAIRQQIASAINIVLQLNRLRDGSRKITAISEVLGMEGETITMQDIFLLKAEGSDKDGNLKSEMVLTGVRPQILDRLFDMGLPLPPEISRLFPDRRGDHVSAVRLPTPPAGSLQRRLG